MKQIRNDKKGVAIFMVLFVMIILGVLIVQFFTSGRQARSSVYRFQTSEMARQLAYAGEEEAYKFLFDQIRKPYKDDRNTVLNDVSQLIIEKDPRIDLSKSSLSNRNSISGIPIPLKATEELANEMMPGRMDISASARIIDFRNTDYDGNLFYDKEGIGTLEIAVTVKAKDKYKKQFPGACTIVRHHDYKVVSILSKKENRESIYTGNSLLDYVLFVKKGQSEFERSQLGAAYNPKDIGLEINAESGSALGKVNLGSSGANYAYLNLGKDTANLIDGGTEIRPIKELEASDKELDSFFPYFKTNFVEKAKAMESHVSNVEVWGHKANFYYRRIPLTKDYVNTDTLKGHKKLATLIGTMQNKLAMTRGDDFEYYDGIKILPQDNNKLKEILNSDIRKQFLNFGSFKIDYSNCQVKITIKYKSGFKTKTESKTVSLNDPQFAETIARFKDADFPCYNTNNQKEEIKTVLENSFKDDRKRNVFNFDAIYKYITEKSSDSDIASKAFTYVNSEFAYGPEEVEPNKNEQLFYRPSNSDSPTPRTSPADSHYPYTNFNLFTKRNLTADDLVRFGIYDKQNHELHLHGIVHCDSEIVLGESGSDLKVDGCGVLIGRTVKIEGAIRKTNTYDVCVIYARDGIMSINTDQPIEAVLIAADRAGGNSLIRCDRALNLKGALITDNLNLQKWKEGVTHKIAYDEALAPTKDIYQIDLTRRVTFERVIENE